MALSVATMPSPVDLKMMQSRDGSSLSQQQAEGAARQLIELWRGIAALEDVDSKSPESRCLFDRLFDVMAGRKMSRATIAMILDDPRIQEIGPSLRQVLSEAEFGRELSWSRRILDRPAGQESMQQLLDYPYLDSYRQIVETEMTAVRAAVIAEQPDLCCRRVAMLGSGPLPMTSIIVQRFWGEGCSVLNVDRDAEALDISQRIVERCGIGGMDFALADLKLDPPDLCDCDLVYIAGMVGGSAEEKSEIIAKVVARMRPGALVILRSTHSLGELVYGRMDLESGELWRLLTPLVSIRYYSQVPRAFHVAMVDHR